MARVLAGDAKAARYFRDAAEEERARAAAYTAQAAMAPVESRAYPSAKYPEGYLSRPRANTTAAAQNATLRSEEYDRLAARLIPQESGERRPETE